MFPLNRRNYDELLNLFHSAADHWNNALTRSDPHFEAPEEGHTLRLPPLHQTWSDISVVFTNSSLGLTTGLSQETFRQVHKSWHDSPAGQNYSALSFITSLFQYLMDEVVKEMAGSRIILKEIEESLAGKITTSATDTGLLRDLWIEQEVPLGRLSSKLTGLIVSAGEARSRLEYLSQKNLKHSYLGDKCEERLTEMAFLEQRINTNISVVCHPSPNILSPELTTALTT